MTPHDDPRLPEFFAELIDLSQEDRESRLAGIEAGEPELAQALRELLGHHDDPAEFLVAVDTSAERQREPGANVPDRIGSYEVEGILGRGGMGIVYRGKQEAPERAVAIKVVRPGLLTGSMAKRFEREVQVLGLLNHPGIVQVYDAGVCDLGFGEQAYFAMELVDGEELSDGEDLHACVQRATVPQKCEFVARIADAIHYAHECSVIHRDLKPANILVVGSPDEPEGLRPKLLDFGIARIGQEGLEQATLMTRHGTLLGTLPYMSPEQASSGLVSRASDVYSIGVLLFEVLTGRVPLDLGGKSLTEAVRILQEKEPPLLRKHDPGLKGDLEVIVRKAMAKEVDQRYPTAAAFADDLRRFVRSEPVRARPLTTWYQVRRFARRNVALTASLAALSLALIGGMGGTTAFAFESERNASLAQQSSERADRNAERAAQRAYAGQSLAASSQVVRDPYGAAATLEATAAPYRGFEWRVMTAMIDQADLLFPWPAGVKVWAKAFSVEGEPLAAMADGRRIWIVDVRAKRVVREWEAPAEVGMLVLSADGARIAAGMERSVYYDRLVVWETAGGPPIFDQRDPGMHARGMAFSPDNRFLLGTTHHPKMPLLRVDLQEGTWKTFRSSSWDRVRIQPDSRTFSQRSRRYDIVTGARDGSFFDYDVDALLSPDGRHLAGLRRLHRLVYLADPDRRETKGDRLVAFRSVPKHLQFSADSSLLMSSCSSSGGIKVCDTRTRQLRYDIAIPCDGNPLLHPTGESVLTATPRGLELVGLKRSRCVLQPHGEYVAAACFSPDGQLVASADLRGEVSVWNADDGTLLRRSVPYRQEARGIAFSRDGLSLIVHHKYGSNYEVDLATGGVHWLPKPEESLAGPIWDRVQPGGRLQRGRVLSADGTTVVSGMRLLDRESGRTREIPGLGEALADVPAPAGFAGVIQQRMSKEWTPSDGMCVAVRDDLALLATGHRMGVILIWDLESGEVRRWLRGHTGAVMSLAFTPDGRLLSGGIDSQLCVWDPETGDRLALFDDHERGIESIVVSPDGSRALTASADRTVRIWDTVVGWQRADAAAAMRARRAAMQPHVEAVIAGQRGDVAKALHAIWTDVSLPLIDRQAARELILLRR